MGRGGQESEWKEDLMRKKSIRKEAKERKQKERK